MARAVWCCSFGSWRLERVALRTDEGEEEEEVAGNERNHKSNQHPRSAALARWASF